MWMEDVNEAGGIKLADGSVVKFESKFYDDESNKDRVQELYTKLVTEDNADFLITPILLRPRGRFCGYRRAIWQGYGYHWRCF